VAILYPNEVEDIYILGTKFTGNVVSVGKDGNYAYDYDHPHTATVSEPNGTLVLIYAGTYRMGGKNVINNKDVLWRGMTDSPLDIVLQSQATSYTIFHSGGTYDIVILENVGSPIMGVAFGHREFINFDDAAPTTNVYVNKCNFQYNAARSGDALFGFDAYEGNAYFSYTRAYTGDARNAQYAFIGAANINATYQFYGMEYAGSYKCLSCAKSPDPHIYNVGAAENYGYDYGKYLIQFVPAPDTSPWYQNVWVVDDYIYHTRSSGIDVYNNDASELDYHISLPNAATAVWANDNYIYMGTSTSGVYRATISGTASPYLTAPDIMANDTIYLHGAEDYLCITTVSGVDRYNFATSSGIYSPEPDIYKCHQTMSGTLYYLENSPFFGIDRVHNGLDDIHNWKYYTYMSFLPTTVSDTQVNVVFQYTFPYDRVGGAGDDIRFIDSTGRNMYYYILDWYPSGNIIVDVDRPGIDHFYMLYGNSTATAQSSFLYALWTNETYTGQDYVLWDLVKPKLHAVYNPNSNWTDADYVYEEFYGAPLILNDIHITEETSSYNNDNTIFLATDRGAHIIEERQDDEENTNQKRYYIK